MTIVINLGLWLIVPIGVTVFCLTSLLLPPNKPGDKKNAFVLWLLMIVPSLITALLKDLQ